MTRLKMIAVSKRASRFSCWVVVITFVCITEPVHGCQCSFKSRAEVEFVSDYNTYEIIFIGSVAGFLKDQKNDEKLIVFKLIDRIKTPGNLKQTVEVRTQLAPSSCGLVVSPGEKWLVFARKTHENNFFTDMCFSTEKFVRNKLRSRAAKELRFIKQLLLNPDGYYQFQFEDGTRGAAGSFRNKLPHGVWRYYRSDGTPFQVCYFNQGVLDSLQFYYSTKGTKYREDRIYKNGILFSYSTVVNRRLVRETTILEYGHMYPKTVYVKTYYENGQVKEEGKYRLNQRVGTWKVYEKNGKLKEEIQY